jgi:uncharacterized protein YfaS (alpha-2-macroglobulin family)
MRVGDTVTITVTVRTNAGTLIDATALSIVVRDADDVDSTYSYPDGDIVRSSIGVYTLAFTIPTTANPGTYQVRTRATGDASGTGAFGFEVKGIWDA